ncbi:MAG: hypothetical protein WBD47_03125 [Phormidesmis sp.]
MLVTLLSWMGTANASEDHLVGLSFELPPVQHSASPAKVLSQASAIDSPVESHIDSQKAPVTIAALDRYKEPLPPLVVANDLIEQEPKEAAIAEQPIQPAANASDDIALSFDESTLELPKLPELPEKSPERPSSPEPEQAEAAHAPTANTPTEVAYDTLGLDDWIFTGGASSLVAHTVGSAEGTRLPDGGRTRAYYGHVDPGNGVWNMGTFSYQHGASTPEEADEKQLTRLKGQGLALEEQASHLGRKLSLEEKLNGLDLANQAPLAALGKGGYIERLDQAYRLEMRGFEAISWARTRSYIDPDTKQWNAPGLGNNLHTISQDQERRMSAITQALQAYDRNQATGLALAKLETISLDSAGSESADLESADLNKVAAEQPAPTPLSSVAESDLSDLQSDRTPNYSALSFGLPENDQSPSVQVPIANTPTTESHPADTAQLETPVEQAAAIPAQTGVIPEEEVLEEVVLEEVSAESIAAALPVAEPNRTPNRTLDRLLASHEPLPVPEQTPPTADRLRWPTHIEDKIVEKRLVEKRLVEDKIVNLKPSHIDTEQPIETEQPN